MTKKLAAAMILSLMAVMAHADEASVKKAVEAKMNAKVDAIRKTPYMGLYEIQSGGEVLYTDEKAAYLFHGDIIDMNAKKNITQDRVNELSKIKFSDLPLDMAVKTVRGNGKRVIATFEDPNCGYCRRMAKEMATMDNVTVYTFLFPILSKDSYDKSKAIWCAPDRSKAWQDMMQQGVAPSNPGTCETPVDKTLQLGQKLNIRGTPTIFLASGDRIPGAVPVAQLEQMMGKVGSAK